MKTFNVFYIAGGFGDLEILKVNAEGFAVEERGEVAPGFGDKPATFDSLVVRFGNAVLHLHDVECIELVTGEHTAEVVYDAINFVA